MALVIALALMTGLQSELRNRILGSNAHVYVWKQGGLLDYHAEIKKIETLPHVLGAAPAILGKGLMASGGREEPIQIKGIDPALEPDVTDIRPALLKGSLDDLEAAPGRPAGVLLGKDLAASLGVGVGDSVYLLTLEGTLSPMGMIPGRRPLRVAGIFNLGLYEFDSTYGFVSLTAAERMFQKDTPDYIQLRVDDFLQAPAIARSISERFGKEYIGTDWSSTNQPLFSALWLEKMAISITIGLIVMVAALNIIASLILLVMEKNRDIAILKTMGASAKSVTTIFMMQGLIIGIVGTAVGAALGYGASYILNRYRLIHVPVDVYQVSYIPFTVLPLDFTLVVVSAVIVCFLATIYPSRQAARLDPAQALRYE